MFQKDELPAAAKVASRLVDQDEDGVYRLPMDIRYDLGVTGMKMLLDNLGSEAVVHTYGKCPKTSLSPGWWLIVDGKLRFTCMKPKK